MQQLEQSFILSVADQSDDRLHLQGRMCPSWLVRHWREVVLVGVGLIAAGKLKCVTWSNIVLYVLKHHTSEHIEFCGEPIPKVACKQCQNPC